MGVIITTTEYDFFNVTTKLYFIKKVYFVNMRAKVIVCALVGMYCDDGIGFLTIFNVFNFV